MGRLHLGSDPTRWFLNESLLRYDALGTYLAVPCGECGVSAAGGSSIAAFTHELALPSPVTITQPTPSSLALPLRRGEDVDIRWTGGGAGHVMLNLYGSLAPGGDRAIVCCFPAGAGGGTIPGELLRTYQPGQGFLSLWRENTERIRPSHFDLQIRTTLGLTRPDGANGYSVPFQLGN